MPETQDYIHSSFVMIEKVSSYLRMIPTPFTEENQFIRLEKAILQSKKTLDSGKCETVSQHEEMWFSLVAAYLTIGKEMQSFALEFDYTQYNGANSAKEIGEVLSAKEVEMSERGLLVRAEYGEMCIKEKEWVAIRGTTCIILTDSLREMVLKGPIPQA